MDNYVPLTTGVLDMSKKPAVKPTNTKFMKDDKSFNDACKMAGITPTKRQASKYRRGLGLAYQAAS